DEKLENAALRLLHALAKPAVELERLEAACELPAAEGSGPIADWFGCIFGVAPVNTQRSAMSWKFLDIEERETVRGEYPFYCPEGKIAEVLVVDRIELVFVNQPFEMRE